MLFVVLPQAIGQYSFLYKTPIYIHDLPHSIEGNSVQDIHQDELGYIWFATKNGLVRYNGSHYLTYKHSVLDSTSISHNQVEKILQTRDGSFWVGTWGGGLNKFDRKTGTFTRFRHSEGVGTGLSDNFISDMLEDQAGHLWIATGNGLNRLHLKTGVFTHYFSEPDNPRSLSHNKVRTLLLDHQNTLWVGTGFPWMVDDEGGLNRYDPATDSFRRYVHNPQDPTSIANNKISALFEDSKQNLWVGTGNNGIYLLNRNTGTFDYQEQLSTFAIDDPKSRIRSFFEQADGKIWVLSYGSGLKLYDPVHQKILDEIYNDDVKSSSNFPLNEAWKMYESRDGTRWVFTGDMGQTVYKSNTIFPFLGFIWAEDDIQSIHVDRYNDDFWTARRLNGLSRNYWLKFQRFRTWFKEPTEKYMGTWSFGEADNADTFDNIFSMLMDQEGFLWFGKHREGKGLFQFHPEKESLRTFTHQPGDANSLANDTILDIAAMRDSDNIWILTEGEVLHRLHKPSQQIDRFSKPRFPNFPANPRLLHFTKDGTLLLASIAEGRRLSLTRFSPGTDQMESLDIVHLPAPDTNFVLTGVREAADGTIWLGTERSLHKISPDQVVRQYPTEDNGVGDIRSFVVDKRGYVWLATLTGIFVFDPAQERYILVSGDEDIPNLPFSLRSAAVLPTGEVLFGGKGGCLLANEATLNRFYHSIQPPQTIDSQQVLITAFFLNGKEIKEGSFAIDSILRTHVVKLGHEENNFSFELSLLEFNNPALHRFEYFLENYDKYWREAGDKNTAYYSQIPPGEYTFRVRAYNSVGAYGESIPLHITVLPPWWRTWWAYTAYVLLLGGLIYGIYRFQLGRQLAHAEARRLQELDTAKSQLYTNITHEFRTPLTVILGMAKQLEGQVTESQKLMVEMIGRNGQNLLNLVNQMLDLAKLESGQMTLNLQQADLISYLRYLVESFHSYAEIRGVKVHFLSDLESQEMDFDPYKMQQIISNLVSNAIKFTPTGGDIYISVTPAAQAGEMLSIRIKDTGIGIEASRLPHIFHRFYQADDSHTKKYQGTGVGLALVAELVKLMDGQISAKSELGKGTEITLLLPVTQTAEKNLDLSYFAKAKMQFYREGIAPEETTDAVLTADKTADKPTVLIVEDNFDVRTYIRACLSDKFTLMSAENGQRGVEMAIEHVPDFIVSDVMMPLKDGYTLVKELKADYRTSHIPIILLTAKADTDSKLRGLVQGADAYLAKPFDPKELQIRIQKLLELRKRLQQRYLSSREDTNGQSPAAASAESVLTEQENKFVQKVTDIILDHLDNFDLDVQTLCREIGMSHSQLHRKLSALTGLSTNKFVRHIRLAQAKKMLQDNGKTISEVAFDTGFKDPSYFGRVFKQETGMTPAEWQRT